MTTTNSATTNSATTNSTMTNKTTAINMATTFDMRTVKTIAGKEFRSYFQSPIAYIFITAFLVLTHFFFFRGFFLINQATMREFFALIPIVFLFFVPALTMRMWAEERKLGTTELLLTFPVKDWEAVVGKFSAALGFLAVALGCTLPLALTVILLGRPDGGALVGGYLGSLLLGATYLAIGLWISSLTSNQIVAFILGLFGCFGIYMVGEPIILSAIPQALGLRSLFANLSVGYHFDSMGRGVLDLRDLLYYVSVIAFFLFLNIRAIESRKWS